MKFRVHILVGSHYSEAEQGNLAKIPIAVTGQLKEWFLG